MKIFKCNSAIVLIPDYYTIMQACWKISIFIPRFCFYDKLSIAGNCRMCLVEIKGSLKPIASCALNVDDNLEIFTESYLILQARKFILEFLLINHPLDCPICDQGGECDLQDQTFFYGNSFSRFFFSKKSTFNTIKSPFIKSSMNRCIHCTRCVRFSEEVCSSPLGTLGRGSNMEISHYIEDTFFSEFSGNVTDLCPVGALLPRLYLYQSRSWEFNIIESIDISDSYFSNISFYKKGLDIFRILPTLITTSTFPWITDRTRFMSDGFFLKRLFIPCVKIFLFKKISYLSFFLHFNYSHIYHYLYYCFSYYFSSSSFKFYIGDGLDLETSFMLKYFFTFKSCSFISFSFLNRNLLNSDLRTFFLINSLSYSFFYSDIFFIIGNSLRKELPIINLKLKKISTKKNLLLYYLGSYTDFNCKVLHFDFLNKSFFLSFFFCHTVICKLFLKYSHPLFFFLNFNFLTFFTYLFTFFNLIDFISLCWRSFNFVSNSCGLINLLEINALFPKYSSHHFN